MQEVIEEAKQYEEKQSAVSNIKNDLKRLVEGNPNEGDTVELVYMVPETSLDENSDKFSKKAESYYAHVFKAIKLLGRRNKECVSELTQELHKYYYDGEPTKVETDNEDGSVSFSYEKPYTEVPVLKATFKFVPKDFQLKEAFQVLDSTI